MSDHSRIALFGGSFDPPHLGHRRLVDAYLHEMPRTELLLIVPNRISPFKDYKHFSNEEILTYCELNFQGLDPERVRVLDYELKKDAPSYTYETILECKKIYPMNQLDLILGEDQFESIPKWKEFETILQEVDRFVIFRRFTEPPEPIRVPQPLLGCNTYIFENPLWEESSSDWRNWPNEETLHPPVLNAMKKLSLDMFNPDSIDAWTEIVKSHVTETRMDHILLVAKIAKELAVAHRYPFPEKMELAGILHDITKQKTKEFHIDLFKKHGFQDYYQYPPSSYHAYSAYFFLQDNGILDTDILTAVKSHTLGNGNMSLAESILYTADYLGSDYAKKDPNYNLWCNHVAENLAFGIYLKSKNTLQDLTHHNKSIHPNTLEAYNSSLHHINQE